jgi:hypothetical protein
VTTNPNDPVGMNAHANLVPEEMPVEWVSRIISQTQAANGLTKREFFAALAMQGMIAGSQGLRITVSEFAKQSVLLADALIAELNKAERPEGE